MEKYSLDVTGDLPLEFEGEKLGTFSSEWCNNQENDRFHIITLYKAISSWSPNSYYVLHLEYETRWQGEDCLSLALNFPSIDEIRNHLLAYDPLEYYEGLPDNDCYKERRKRSMQKLSRNFDGIKVLALKSLGCKRSAILDNANPSVSLTLTIPASLYELAVKDDVNLSELLVTELQNREDKNNG